ncbi:MAG TPA: imidazole glycerol phosphate synthase subunit HisH [Deltaproteobacteria bacterium]|nr:imidazole glycerol phosphate synthase subunit HisH [Deltaproteobacteria bacterium]
MIVVVDYGMGNLKSVLNAFSKLGADITVSGDPRRVEEARAIVLPGVGAFGKCMENLETRGLAAVIRDHIARGKRYLGICLGMQILFESSEETPGVGGLGIIKGAVPRFTGSVKVPHMGWNSITILKESPIFTGIQSGDFFYFVHSYYCAPVNGDVIATTTDYDRPFASSVESGTLFACQFHPEKSQRVGLKLLKNFLELTRAE